LKNVAILVFGIVIGYGLFAYLNPSPPFITRTIKQINTVPIEVKETRYHSPDAIVVDEKLPSPIVDIKVEPVVERKKVSKDTPNSKDGRSDPLSQRIANRPDLVTFGQLQKTSYLLITDPRIASLKGLYSGRNKIDCLEARTDGLSQVNLKIGEERTSLNIIDSYDNRDSNLSFTSDSSKVFKAVLGDLNLLLMHTQIDSCYFVFDLRSLPDLKGKLYWLNSLKGEIELKKKEDRK
jgi:hypothetical protein